MGKLSVSLQLACLGVLPIEGHGVGLGRTENGYCLPLPDTVVAEAVFLVDTRRHAAHRL